MSEKIQYPFEDMQSTSQDLCSFIQDQWNQHNALFMTHPDSFSALLKTIVRIIPNGLGKVHELEQGLENYHQQYKNAYASLHDLAKKIDKSAQLMGLTDESVKNTFDSSQNTHS
ncbi:hypothetical protein [Tengunoibacter tsumagoiensis]|uniref:Uncharacterized protein n=1 Tax=Tengunoibacter tsumagoiensis TaxID=2014871 RepID=A0A402A442_9CHLR|nr:hypothetical protein [Tengunoibacter tsumagoiensis]GCE13882.1 hypothetical protein KTT_37410 [Tengunoibacter tsumagoiensis]